MPFDFNEGRPADSRGGNIPRAGSSHGFQNAGSTPARGFKNAPERKNPGSAPGTFQTPSAPGRRGDTYQGRPRQERQRRSYSRPDIVIPWRIIGIIVGIVMLVAALWIYRDAISAFLSQVLSWVITILVIIFLVKYFILRR